jgi:hypothetical protein
MAAHLIAAHPSTATPALTLAGDAQHPSYRTRRTATATSSVPATHAGAPTRAVHRATLAPYTGPHSRRTPSHTAIPAASFQSPALHLTPATAPRHSDRPAMSQLPTPTPSQKPHQALHPRRLRHQRAVLRRSNRCVTNATCLAELRRASCVTYAAVGYGCVGVSFSATRRDHA